MVLNCVQHIFPGVAKNFAGGFSIPATLVTGLVTHLFYIELHKVPSTFFFILKKFVTKFLYHCASTYSYLRSNLLSVT